MNKFILGVILTLAIIYPAVTKNIFGKVVDTTHSTVTTVIEKNK
jgi:hypothetical protein